MKRSAPLRRSGRLKARNAARRKREFARCYHSAERVEFVKALPCAVCYCTPSENAHTTGGGASRKADYTTIAPLCAFHHAQLHRIGVDTFQIRHVIRLRNEAAHTQALWQRHCAAPVHISSVIPAALAGLEGA